jgi:hypothetical protein
VPAPSTIRPENTNGASIFSPQEQTPLYQECCKTVRSSAPARTISRGGAQISTSSSADLLLPEPTVRW